MQDPQLPQEQRYSGASTLSETGQWRLSLKNVARLSFLTQICLSLLMIVVMVAYTVFNNIFFGFYPKTGLLPFRTTEYSLLLLFILSVADIFFSLAAYMATLDSSTAGLGMFSAARSLSMIAYFGVFMLTTQWNGSEVIVAGMYGIFSLFAIYVSTTLYMVRVMESKSQGTGETQPLNPQHSANQPQYVQHSSPQAYNAGYPDPQYVMVSSSQAGTKEYQYAEV